MNRESRVCVFCGSAAGRDGRFGETAERTGEAIAAAGFGLVYGGGRVGLMGRVADGALRAGGRVWGVIPRALTSSEIAHDGITELFVVNTMHERKAMMAHLSSAFVVLPGGFGTLEETMEILTWLQLGLHDKPVGLLDISGFFEQLFAFFDHAERSGFLTPRHRELLHRSDDPSQLIDDLKARLTEP